MPQVSGLELGALRNLPKGARRRARNDFRNARAAKHYLTADRAKFWKNPRSFDGGLSLMR
jgi:hypothetical protein